MGLIIRFPYKEEELPNNGSDYIELCKKELTQDDYEELLCCIIDETYYNNADEQIRAIVDCYRTYLE